MGLFGSLIKHRWFARGLFVDELAGTAAVVSYRQPVAGKLLAYQMGAGEPPHLRKPKPAGIDRARTRPDPPHLREIELIGTVEVLPSRSQRTVAVPAFASTALT